jgi:hypothetical protein
MIARARVRKIVAKSNASLCQRIEYSFRNRLGLNIGRVKPQIDQDNNDFLRLSIVSNGQ